MIASALAGALLIWTLRGRTVRQPERGAAKGCVALIVLDLPFIGAETASGREALQRLRDRVEDVLLRRMPQDARLERRDIDRFMLVLPEVEPDAVATMLEDMREMVSRMPLVDLKETLVCTVSVGVACIHEGEGLPDALVRAARAVSFARARGGNRVVTEADTFLEAPDKLRLEIEAAIAEGALRYDLQPIQDLRDGRNVGAEALLRWHRPDGDVSPMLLGDILDRMPEMATDQIPDMVEQAARPVLDQPGAYLSINITGAVLDGPGSPNCRWLTEILERIPPERLVVEIVEHAVMAWPERSADLIGQLRARGVRVALDDFGTGLSNLDRLRRMKVDILKIDRAFVTGLGESGRVEIILRHLLAMADELGMETVAEGIEREDQAEALAALGFRYGQGYLLGRPAPASEWSQGGQPTTA